MQDKSNLGTRYTCFDCGKKFYDLNKPEPVCPGCGVNQLEDPTPDPRVAVMAKYKGSRMTAKEAAPSKEAIEIEGIEDAPDGADDELPGIGD
ncbi:MAG: TIGR02300 family protein, partial [Myxococcota bacterium]